MDDVADPQHAPAPDARPGTPFGDFTAAVREVLAHLHRRHGMGLWLFTRTLAGDQYVLHAEDHEYGVAAGEVFDWSESLCARMVSGRAPQAAPRTADERHYAAAPAMDRLRINAYLGVPLHTSDGELFGTLCAIDPEPTGELDDALAEATVLGRLLVTLLERDLELDVLRRRAEQLADEARTDPLCGVGNRRALEEALAAADARFERYGEPVTIVAIDLDRFKDVNDRDGHATGDELLRRTAEVLRSSVRDVDHVARSGGDEFTVLLTRVDERHADLLLDRLRAALVEIGVAASMGAASRGPRRTMAEACELADRRMYADKRSRHAGRGRLSTR